MSDAAIAILVLTPFLAAGFFIIIQKLNNIMTKEERLLAAFEEINQSTNDIAADLDSVLEDVRTGTVSEASVAKIESASAALKLVAAKVPNPPTEEEGPGTEG